jgi:hypothetical protein
MKKTRRHTSKGIVEAKEFNVPAIAACTAVIGKDSVKRQFLAAKPYKPDPHWPFDSPYRSNFEFMQQVRTSDQQVWALQWTDAKLMERPLHEKNNYANIQLNSSQLCESEPVALETSSLTASAAVACTDDSRLLLPL